MSTAYELAGRTRQKQRTREALVAAAQAMVSAGHSPTVEEAAEAAGVSRTTAYRYFPSQHALLAAAHPETALESMLPETPPGDPQTRLALVMTAFTEMIARTEQQQRTMLKLSLEARDSASPPLPLRQGRAIAWIEEALEPLRAELGDATLRTLAMAIRSATGIESLIWLRDIAGLDPSAATTLQRWMAASLCQAAIDGSPPPLPSRPRKRHSS